MNHSKALWTIIITTIISILALIVTGSKCVYAWIFSFEKANELGDFVGGVAGPIIAIGGAYLVYLTIKAQIEANQMQREALRVESEYRNRNDEIQSIEKTIDSIKEDIRNLTLHLRLNQEQITVTGLSALELFRIHNQKGIPGTFHSVLQTLASILSDLVVVRSRIMSLEASEIRDVLFGKTRVIYAFGVDASILPYVSASPPNDAKNFEWDVLYNADKAFHIQNTNFKSYSQ